MAFGTQHRRAGDYCCSVCGLSLGKQELCRRARMDCRNHRVRSPRLCDLFYVQQGLDGALSWQYSLPLELCNLVLIACIVSLSGRTDSLSKLPSGAAGCFAGDDPRTWPWDSLRRFLPFFWSHGRLWPRLLSWQPPAIQAARRGIVRMMLALNVYGIAVGAIDALAGWNYGYLCHKPAVPSLLDFLGPWPWYLISIEGVALLSFVILYLPWRIGESLRTSKAVVD